MSVHRLIPYGRHAVTEEDIAAVVDVLRSDWLTTGPKVEEFEQALAVALGAAHVVALSSGTAALHAAVFAAQLGPDDEVITTPLTFCATANAILYQGATPVFADVRPDTLTIDVDAVASRITPRTKALIPVDYGGHPADLDELLALADRHGLIVIEDAAHALGATYRKRPIGSISHMSTFSFHPVKHLTTGEGGAVATNDPALARRLRKFRNHGIDRTAGERESTGEWYYEMTELGYNYRLSDIACALGLSQLPRLAANVKWRREIARRYDRAFAGIAGLRVPTVLQDVEPAWHLYPIRVEAANDRDRVFQALRAEGLGVNMHYFPVHLQPYYRNRFGSSLGAYPIAEQAGDRLISLPMYHGMSDADIEYVIGAVQKVFAVSRPRGRHRRADLHTGSAPVVNVVVIIQARMRSTRLPGKVLADVAGRPMLTRVVERVLRAKTPDTVLIATTTAPDDDVVAEHARELGVAVFRGDEQDVLGRYYRAASQCRADLVVRVTADCPLIDPDVLDRVVEALRDASPRAAFASSTIHRSFPRGLDVEAMWTADLARLHEVVREPWHRAHVFPYVYEHPDEFPAVSVSDPVDRSGMRWTVDTPEDLEFVRRVTASLTSGDTSWRGVLAVLERHPEWLEINRHIQQKSPHAL